MLQKCGFTWRRRLQQELEICGEEEDEGKNNVMHDVWKVLGYNSSEEEQVGFLLVLTVFLIVLKQ